MGRSLGGSARRGVRVRHASKSGPADSSTGKVVSMSGRSDSKKEVSLLRKGWAPMGVAGREGKQPGRACAGDQACSWLAMNLIRPSGDQGNDAASMPRRNRKNRARRKGVHKSGFHQREEKESYIRRPFGQWSQ